MVKAAEGIRQHPMLAQRASEPGKARDRGRGGQQQNGYSAQADEYAQRRGKYGRHMRSKGGDDSHQGSASPLAAKRSGAVLDRERRQTDDGDQHVDDDHGAYCREQVSRQLARIATLLREVGNGLDAREGEHRQRQGKGERSPTGSTAEMHSRRTPVPGEEHRQAEPDQNDLSN